MTRNIWALGVILFIGVLVACSGAGGGNNTLVGIGSNQFRLGTITATLHVPAKHAMQRIDHMVARALRARHVKPRYLPDSTSEVDFTLESVGGVSVGQNSSYNFSLYPSTDCATPAPTAAPSGASPAPTPPVGFNCSITTSAPAAADQFDIIACTGTVSGCLNGNGAVLLSESYTVINVPPGGNASAQFSLNPVVGGLSWTGAAPWGNGTEAPTWNATYYSCSYTPGLRARPNGKRAHGAGGCYDPILDDTASASYPGLVSTPQSDMLVLNVTDQNGATIVPASGGGTLYTYPIYLTALGTVDDITSSCDDPNVQILNQVPSFAIDPSPVPASDKANGFTGATHAHVTSPVTGHDGASGSDFNGTPVTIYGNDAAYVNFDGGSNGYAVDQYQTCTATDATTPSPYTSAYYVGLGLGSINWGGNARHRSHVTTHH